MITKHNSPLIISVLFLLCFSMNHNLSEGADSITVSQSLFANQTIVSAAGIFELGFFTPGNSSRYYVGIWYKNISQRTYVWVANREPPISDINSAELKISDGNLVLSDNTRVSIWSTNLNSTTSNSVIATLHDNGNLVLHDGSISNSNDEGFWQSFDYPVDTWLPGGKIAYDKRRRTKQLLISWKNSEDPAPGLFSLEFDPIGRQYVIRWNRTKQYWTSGAWNGHIFSLVPEMSHNDIYNLTYVDNDNETYLTYSLYNHSIISRATMDISGQLKMTRWSGSTKEWTLFWSQPTQCQVYAYCGAFGICSHNSLPSCSCLPGFTQKSVNDWDLRDYSRGCEREFHLQQCGNDSAASSMRQDRFLVTTNVSLPENSQNVNSSVGECEFICLNICSCKAYTYDGNTCSVWNGELLNLQRLSGDDGSGRTINVRLAASALSKEVNRFTKGDLIATVACSIAFVIALLAIVGTVIRRRKRRILETTEEIQGSSVVNLELWGDYSTGIGVPFVSWESILAATDNFSDVHKLGRGGFGPVYKGTFPGGKEVAVKRLSSLSTQGFNEFQNEVVLITKLQHRNLVRLVGYCITENEKILLYEYLPNKSLDVFIFDKKLSILLNWRKRYEIILGIARGVLYLHRDSRLTIIHRDLKTSNILLDEDMNPKISDFGLARIFEEDKGAQANTNRVVGTYGYMSPEYATYGIFSMKLDAFGFGVIILEIISGKKNTGFYQSTEAMNLLSYAWKLWSENRALDLLDPILVEFCEKSEVVKCINIGLLCVEEDPVARPTMSNAVLMLSGETTVVPVPNQPAFAMRRHVFNTSPSSSNKPDCISNELTMSAPQGR